MDQLALWRGMALDHAIAHDMDLEQFRQGQGLVFWWYADLARPETGHRRLDGVFPPTAEFLYCELYRDPNRASWVVLGATFTSETGKPSVQPFVVKSARPAAGETHEMSFELVSQYLPHAHRCRIIAALSSSGHYAVRTASVEVALLDQSTPPKKTGMLKRVIEEFVSGGAAEPTTIDTPCPICGGRGSATTFAIPKEEWDRGLTGYALYSCNTINASVACAYCGGEGSLFKEWYLNEDPRRRLDLKPYRPGTGRFRAQRPPARGKLDAV